IFGTIAVSGGCLFMTTYDEETALDHGRNRRYTRIRARAGEIWQQEGCPDNRHEHHWLLALRQIDLEDALSSAARFTPEPVGRPVVRAPVRQPVMRPAGAHAMPRRPAFRQRSGI
ncbi:DUF2934 domain-containing protein, partial [Mesorhizobium sp. NPDC059054]|uniref:DUF2934 domain-containing protein n=1 Tax=Mesorhizobium sp. NPDC059054 TaxID=3346711 RepID=UPI00369D7E6D